MSNEAVLHTHSDIAHGAHGDIIMSIIIMKPYQQVCFQPGP
jgi:hypothetical protein